MKNLKFTLYSLKISILSNFALSVNLTSFKDILHGKQHKDTDKENDFHSVEQTQISR